MANCSGHTMPFLLISINYASHSESIGEACVPALAIRGLPLVSFTEGVRNIIR